MDKLFRNNSLEEFTEVCNKVINEMINFKKADTQNENDYSSAKKEMRDIICNTCCNISSISSILHEAGYEEDKIKYFISTVDKNKNELLYQIIINHNSKHGETMGTFDWAVKMICGTSELKTLRYPVLALALTTYTDGVQKQRLYEMDKNMLGRLIQVLENNDKIEYCNP